MMQQQDKKKMLAFNRILNPISVIQGVRDDTGCELDGAGLHPRQHTRHRVRGQAQGNAVSVVSKQHHCGESRHVASSLRQFWPRNNTAAVSLVRKYHYCGKSSRVASSLRKVLQRSIVNAVGLATQYHHCGKSGLVSSSLR